MYNAITTSVLAAAVRLSGSVARIAYLRGEGKNLPTR